MRLKEGPERVSIVKILRTEKQIKKAQQIVKKNKFQSLDAGYIEKGERKVVIKPKNITFTSESLSLR